MSSYGRSWDAVIAVLEAYGVDPRMTVPKMYRRNDDDTTVRIALADALCDAVYATAFDMGERVAIKRIVSAIEQIGHSDHE